MAKSFTFRILGSGETSGMFLDYSPATFGLRAVERPYLTFGSRSSAYRWKKTWSHRLTVPVGLVAL